MTESRFATGKRQKQVCFPAFAECYAVIVSPSQTVLICVAAARWACRAFQASDDPTSSGALKH
jgi:hypothetical protein